MIGIFVLLILAMLFIVLASGPLLLVAIVALIVALLWFAAETDNVRGRPSTARELANDEVEWKLWQQSEAERHERKRLRSHDRRLRGR